MHSPRWAYGVTTCPQRRKDLLPRTLASLKEGGFPDPRLFVDGDWNVENYPVGSAGITMRDPTIRTYGNWLLTLMELYIRNPEASHFAIFQDDFVTYRNLRQYLESCPYDIDAEDDKNPKYAFYWNLYTFPLNQELCPKNGAGKDRVGWYESNQMGRGAVALVFSKQATKLLLTSKHMIDRPEDMHRGWRAVDGGVVSGMNKVGFKEMVHNPSLVQHTGDESSMGNRPHKKATSFRGEEFDAMELISK